MSGKRIGVRVKEEIAQAYLSGQGSQAEIAKQYNVSEASVYNCVKWYNASRLGKALTKHKEAMQEADPHPRTSDWMAHVTPLHKHKQALELAVEHKQAELDAAKQELRDFTATLRQLMEGDV